MVNKVPSPRYDVLVLGGGTAGCVLAARLSEDGTQSVCLVEAGPDYGPADSGAWPPEMLDPRTPSDTHDWEPGGELSLARARVIGGCSSHNACFVTAGSPADYDEWSEAAPEWSYETLKPFLGGADRAIGTRTLADDELGPWVRAVRNGAVEAGIPAIEDFNDPSTPIGVGFVPVNVRDFVRQSTAFAYLDEARGRSNLTVLSETLADRVAIEAGRATGASAISSEGSRELEAERVVVSAGALGSPLILLRSGVGPLDHLVEHGIEVKADLPAVGANLQDHFGLVVMFRPTEELCRELDSREETGVMMRSGTIVKGRSGQCPPDSWDLHLVSWSAPDAEGVTGTPWRVQLTPYVMKPASRGTVRLRSTNPEDHPEVELGYLSDPDGGDLRVLADGVKLAREVAASPAIDRLVEGEVVPGPEVSALDAFMNENVRGYFHHTGTCSMGREGHPGAVVGAAGEVHGVRSLYVCDASIMPTIPRANTNLTTIAIAERIADGLAGP